MKTLFQKRTIQLQFRSKDFFRKKIYKNKNIKGKFNLIEETVKVEMSSIELANVFFSVCLFQGS